MYPICQLTLYIFLTDHKFNILARIYCIADFLVYVFCLKSSFVLYCHSMLQKLSSGTVNVCVIKYFRYMGSTALTTCWIKESYTILVTRKVQIAWLCVSHIICTCTCMIPAETFICPGKTDLTYGVSGSTYSYFEGIRSSLRWPWSSLM